MEEMNQATIEEQYIEVFDTKSDEQIKEWLRELQPYDKAQLYISLPNEYIRRYLFLLTGPEIAELLEELEIDEQSTLIERVGTEKATEIMNAMASDDAADLIGQLPEEHSEEILTAMDVTEAEKIKALLAFPPDTAGGIMTNEYVWIRSHYTVNEAIEKLRAFATIAESIYYIYVINHNRNLLGILSIRDLLTHPGDEKVIEIMTERIISVPVDMDQEEVARIFGYYNFFSVPVVDHDNRLVGIITHDDIVDVIMEEHEEDFSRFGGAGKEAITLQTTAVQSAIRRLPWLIGLLFMGIITASIMSSFEDTLEQVVALAFFLPMIAGMTGNTGTQSLAVVIRGLASGEMNGKEVFRLIRREFATSIMIGLVCGILIFFIALVWKGDAALGAVVGSTLFCTLIIGTLAGTLFPLILNLLKVDPAIASGPLITTLNDIFSLLVYFGIATYFMSSLI